MPYEHYDIGHRFGGKNTPEFIAMNPNRMVSNLLGGEGSTLLANSAVLRYLANHYAQAPFWPSDPSERAQVDKWAEWSKVSVAVNFRVPIFWALVRTPPEQRDYHVIKQAIRKFENCLKIADQ